MSANISIPWLIFDYGFQNEIFKFFPTYTWARFLIFKTECGKTVKKNWQKLQRKINDLYKFSNNPSEKRMAIFLVINKYLYYKRIRKEN